MRERRVKKRRMSTEEIYPHIYFLTIGYIGCKSAIQKSFITQFKPLGGLVIALILPVKTIKLLMNPIIIAI